MAKKVKKGPTRAEKAAAALAKRINDERPERKHVYELPTFRTWDLK